MRDLLSRKSRLDDEEGSSEEEAEEQNYTVNAGNSHGVGKQGETDPNHYTGL